MFSIYLFINNFDWFYFRTHKNYYTQVFLEKCKYAVKVRKDASVYY